MIRILADIYNPHAETINSIPIEKIIKSHIEKKLQIFFLDEEFFILKEDLINCFKFLDIS